ncbi:aminotransferase class I/II-fold pyridoxal phosphate-dependent enzyme [Paraflavitalea speifideaquila]|uniref:aminotransferase class I/II-fold pyridoxal phosphate-dependent enzyme n=1 Tax=Paraflavitalea speifideaquila TaxID=3076558 RepID=UPI0028EF17D4|nr:aminotransferase class I/II-fold pyridoxal phosphate-dependent enzyme [Paraflavitalea speifideiaquila]
MYDQMYWQLTFGTIRHYDPVNLRPAMKAYTVYIDAISKVFAATGVRVGWAFGPRIIMDKMKAILSHVGAWAPMAEQKAVAKYLYMHEDIDAYLHTFRAAVEARLRGIYDGLQQLKTKAIL